MIQETDIICFFLMYLFDRSMDTECTCFHLNHLVQEKYVHNLRVYEEIRKMYLMSPIIVFERSLYTECT